MFGIALAFNQQVLGSIDVGGGKFAVAGQAWAGGFWDGYVAKFNNDGSKIWEVKTNLAGKYDILETLAVLPDGGVLAGGHIDTADTPGLDGQLLRVDKDGKILWQQVYTAPYNQRIRGVTVSGNTAYFVGLDWFKSMWGEVDIATGKILWQISGVIAKSDNDGWHDIARLPDGGWILSGYDNLNGTDSVVQRLDAQKKVLWTYQANLPGNDFFWRGLVGKDGTFTAFGQLSTQNTGPLAVRLNMADGKLIWQFAPNMVDWQVVGGGALAADGSLLLASTLDWYLNQSIGWVKRIDNNGKEMWQRQTSLQGLSGLYGVTPDPSGTWTAQGWADALGGNHAFMQRFNIDGTFQCGP